MLTYDSPQCEQPPNIDVILKDHQKALIHRAMEIECENICGIGIMNDKPGSGKTYAILGLILIDGKKGNVIVVPQNILSQWIQSIEKCNLTYKKFIEYNDILLLYDPEFVNELFEYDVIITTSMYYNTIATTSTSTYQNIERIFFDEIDSIDSLIINKINVNFIWFISASFDSQRTGIYRKVLHSKELLRNITCKCEEDFIDQSFRLEEPNVYKIICKNIYFDILFDGLFTEEEFKILNAMDYSRLKKKFCNKIATNEKEVFEFIIKDTMETIEIETIRIRDIEMSLLYKGWTGETNGSEKRIFTFTYRFLQELNEYNQKAINELKEQLHTAKKSLEESTEKLTLMKERLKNNDLCPSCYTDLKECEIKTVSPCCNNVICFSCTNTWFNTMQKTSCIYCNMENTGFNDYIIIKPTECCILCEKPNKKYYSSCCKKESCSECLNDWYNKLLKEECPFCHKQNIFMEHFKTEEKHKMESMTSDVTNKSKMEYLNYFISHCMTTSSKIIFCSDYSKIFIEIRKLFEKYSIHYLELDDGNIDEIKKSIDEYKEGDANALLLNSHFFGCGLNLECTDTILFLHNPEKNFEKQIIGRAQRPGRKSTLDIWYLMHANEKMSEQKKIQNVIETYEPVNIHEMVFETYTFQECENGNDMTTPL